MLIRVYGVSRQIVTARSVVRNFGLTTRANCEAYEPYRRIIGNREIVGCGFNNHPCYIDCEEFPFPAIRYKECTPEIMALREKERGDWKTLSIEEKKCLYRASFRQTFAEINAPSSEWKFVVGGSLLGCAIGLWGHLWYRHYVSKDWPVTFSPECRIQQYYRMVTMNGSPYSEIPVPPGAVPQVHPKNKKMFEEMKKRGAEIHK